MKSPFSTRASVDPESLAMLATLRARSTQAVCRPMSLAVSTLPNQVELLQLLLRCSTVAEVHLLAGAFGLRAGEEGGRVLVVNQRGVVAAQAWLFD